MTPHLSEAIRMQHGSIAQLKSSFSAAAMGMFTSGYVWFVTDKYGNTGVIPTFGPGSLLIRSRTYMAHNKGLLLGDDMGQLDRGHPVDPALYDPVDMEDPTVAKFQASVDRHLQASQRSPTAQPSPPGVSPSSPTSGVSGSNAPPSPTNPLHPRFLHSSARVSVLSNIMPASLFDGKSPSASLDRNKPQTKVDMLNIGETLHPLFCVSVHEHAWISAGYGVWGKEEWLKKFWTVLDWAKVSRSYEEAHPDHSRF
jgi:Fe-Mn family superoxide dismutase